MNKFLEVINLEVPCVFILNDGTRLDLRGGVPKSGLKAYRDGFPGAEELFKKDKVSEVIGLINKAKRPQDVEILALAKPESVAVKDAAKAKIEWLKENQ
ncbi:MAG: hypothetical protein DCE86_05405 [Flavobacteriaceae bacterium]|nr:MAG: hypothetical protein DCE86_05405 [Flavobacteriaceae bacterium]